MHAYLTVSMAKLDILQIKSFAIPFEDKCMDKHANFVQ